MKIKARLARKTFFFLGDIQLSKSGGEIVIDLKDKGDNTLVAMARAIGTEVIISDTSPKDILELVDNQDLKRQVSLQMGLVKPDFKSQEVVKAEVVEVQVEAEPEAPVEAPVAEAPGKSEDAGKPEDASPPLESYLKGSARAVTNKIRKSDLSDAEKGELYAMEEAGLNRSQVKKVLEV